jgi:hypothetical protein
MGLSCSKSPRTRDAETSTDHDDPPTPIKTNEVFVNLTAKPYDPRAEIKKLKKDFETMKEYIGMRMQNDYGLVMAWIHPMDDVVDYVNHAMNHLKIKNEVIVFHENKLTIVIVSYVMDFNDVVKMKHCLENYLGKDEEASLVDFHKHISFREDAANSKNAISLKLRNGVVYQNDFTKND